MLSLLRKSNLNTPIQAVFNSPTLAALAESTKHYQAVDIPINLIRPGIKMIITDMLPLITLSQADIDIIITHVPGGVSNVQDIHSLTSL